MRRDDLPFSSSLFSSLLFFVLYLVPHSAVASAPSSALREKVPRSIAIFESTMTVARGQPAGRLPSAAIEPIDVQFVAFGETFDLELIPANIFAEGAKVQIFGDDGMIEEDPVPTLYTGGVRGMPGARVVVGLAQSALMGFVHTLTESFVLEPARQFDAAAAEGELVVYRASDIVPEDDWFECPTGGHTDDDDFDWSGLLRRFAAVPAEALRTSVDSAAKWMNPSAHAASVFTAQLRKSNIAVVADYRFFNRLEFNGSSSAVATEMHNVIGIVDNSFLRDASATMRIGLSQVFTTTASDPFDQTQSSCSGYLSSLATWRSGQDHASAGYGITHLFTGRTELVGCTGIAYPNRICHPSQGASFRKPIGPAEPLSRRAFSSAHELGHNYNAVHDNCTACSPWTIHKKICSGGLNNGKSCSPQATCLPAPATCTGGTCIDNPAWGKYNMSDGRYEPTLPFSPCSRPRIINRVAARVCSSGTSGGLGGYRCLEDPDCPGGSCVLNTSDVSCLKSLQCGDVQRDEDVDSSDALAAQNLANCGTCQYDGLADVHPYNNPDGDVDGSDVSTIVAIASGSLAVPTKCGLW